MSLKEPLFSGGETVFCINELQLRKAFDLAMNDPISSPRIKKMKEQIESSFDRNERAALAFILIDDLLGNRTRFQS